MSFELKSFSFIVSCFVAFHLTPALLNALEKVTETYPDGSKKAVYTKDSSGRRKGTYTEYWPNGKKKIVAKYKLGHLHGKYSEYDEKGKKVLSSSYLEGALHGPKTKVVNKTVVLSEVWSAGLLVYPRSKELIEKDLKLARTSKVKSIKGAPEDSAGALRRLREYRSALGLYWKSLTLDEEYTKKCQAAAIILTKLGKMTHNIGTNPGVPNEIFELGKEGAKRSNLHQISDLVRSIDGFMEDSDPTNIDKVGHRRWCVSQKLGKTGFGHNGKYSVMWAVDYSAEDEPTLPWTAFPPSGYISRKLFKSTNAWSLHLNPEVYEEIDKSAVSLKVRKIKNPLVPRELLKKIRPLKFDHFNVDQGRSGDAGVIIFRLQKVSFSAGATFYIEVEGIKKRGEDMPSSIEYFVTFY